MLCPSCKEHQYHPGYETYCLECQKSCQCGCGLSRGITTMWCKHVTDEKIFVGFVKALLINEASKKALIRFTYNHTPQYKEILDKYLVLT